MTELEIIELRYSGAGAKFLRGFKSLYMSLFINLFILGWVNKAMVTILQDFFLIPQDQILFWVGGVMLLTALYSSLSGIWGVAVTDAFQFILAMSGCIALAYIMVYSPEIGGLQGLQEKIPASYLDFTPQLNAASDSGGVSKYLLPIGAFFAFISIQWWSSWYPGAEPGGGGYVAQRMMSAKNERSSLWATLFFQITHYCVRPWPWILVALCAVILYDKGLSPELHSQILALKESGVAREALITHLPALQDSIANHPDFMKQVYFTYDAKVGYIYAMKDFLPDGLRGLLLAAFLAAYMSTIATQLNWGTSYFLNDFYKRFLFSPNTFTSNEKAEKNYIAISRIFTVFIALLSLYVTTRIDSISDTWTFIMECGAGLGLVLILRWYWWRINVWSELVATIAPFVSYAYCHFYLKPYILETQGKEIYKSFNDNMTSFYITVAFTTIMWVLATFLTKPESNQTLLRFYKQVQPQGFWEPIRLMAKMPNNNAPLPYMFICWISSVSLTFSVLFGLGKVFFGTFEEVLIFTGVGVGSFLILLWAMVKREQKESIFEHPSQGDEDLDIKDFVIK